MKNPRSDSLLFPDAIVCFPGAESPAQRLAVLLGIPCHVLDLHLFPDGETLVSSNASWLRPALYQSLDRPNGKLMVVLLAAAALRSCGARAITLIAPYLGYMRQDRAFHPGEAISQHVFGDVLAKYFDAFVSIDPHLHRTRNLSAVFHGKPSLALSAASAMAEFARKSEIAPNTVIVGPDEESQPLVHEIARLLGLDELTARKIRFGDRSVDLFLPAGTNLTGRPAIIVDDVISSGVTVQALATQLRSKGAQSIDVYVTHALCDEAARAALSASGVRSLVSTDTLAHASNLIPIAETIAAGLTASATVS